MEFPNNLKYTPEHEWVRIEEGNIAVVGITDFAQSELGDWFDLGCFSEPD